MAVFIHDFQATPNRTVPVMVASTRDELVYAARAIGIPDSQINRMPTDTAAFSITEAQKEAAIRNNARVINKQQFDNLARLLRSQRKPLQRRIVPR